MSYKSNTFKHNVVPNEKVARLHAEINALSNYELQALRDTLNADQLYKQKTAEQRLNLDNLCVRVLSRRELDVLTLVAAGYSRREIGETLEITPNTAAKHVSSIYRKLNISTIAEATRIALVNGVIAANGTR
jgi:DNA-binding NarL/FixJ family response regulator